MIRNRVEEVLNNPGSDLSVLLGGASGAGMRTFSQAFGGEVDSFYFIESGAMWEAGIGTVTVGPPAKYNRNTVLDNSTGSNSRLNFTGASRIYNYIPASHAAYKQQLDAEIEARKAAITETKELIKGVAEGRITFDETISGYLSNETKLREQQDALLLAWANSIDATRASEDAILSKAIIKANNDRVDADTFNRKLQVDDDAYYRQIQINDDNALASTLRQEMSQQPVSRILGASGFWANNGGRYDPIWETEFFRVALPGAAGFPAVRVFLIMRMTARHIGPDVGDQAMVTRARLFGPDSRAIGTSVPLFSAWAGYGQYGTITEMIRFEQTGIPPGSFVQFTAERSWKEGGPGMQVVDYHADGFVVIG